MWELIHSWLERQGNLQNVSSKNPSKITGIIFSFEVTDLDIKQTTKYNLKNDITLFSIGKNVLRSFLYLKSYQFFLFTSELQRQLNI